MPAPRKPDDPYSSFKSDFLRLMALISRDARFVLIALTGAYPTMKGLQWLLTWLP